MAVESPRVTADVIEASEFPSLSERFRVRGVPVTFVNDEREILGARPERAFVAEVLAAVD